MDIKFEARKLPGYKAIAKEVVKEFNDRPHLLVRIEINGEYFPHRAPHPFIRIKVGKEKYFKDLFTEVSSNNQKLLGYLSVHIPKNGIIEFGYGAEIWGTVPIEFSDKSVARLDKKRLPKDIVIVDDKFLQYMKKLRS
ncbi:MAG: hypothetical protein EPN82_05930 [Bacteroidetes bacterium]|nr:MAG: hypothetical protein EPN82_05930 [Bacteroidota bacterium]